MQGQVASLGYLQIVHHVIPAHTLTTSSGRPVLRLRDAANSLNRVAIKSFSSSRAWKAPNPTLQRVAEVSANNPSLLFVSRTDNPYHNLAIETFLLRHSHPASRIAFFYTNTPCVVFGRNQNPWLECNIAALQAGLWRSIEWDGVHIKHKDNLVPVDLIRRRSGGGTVVHDEGNLNFSFIGPNDKTFSRNEGAEIVVRALKSSDKVGPRFMDMRDFEDVKVNDRHDIVMRKRENDPSKWFKISGSAYKLIKGRALHHGTLLHSSPNLERQPGDTHSPFGNLLRSPAKDYIDAKGVGSVSSLVHNLWPVLSADFREILRETLIAAIQREWQHAYGVDGLDAAYVGDDDCTRDVNEYVFKDAQELMTDEWRFLQTPAFTFTSAPLEKHFQLTFEVNRGVILSAGIKDISAHSQIIADIPQLKDRPLHGVENWHEALNTLGEKIDRTVAAKYFEEMFPRISNTNASATGPEFHEVSTAQDSGKAVRRKKKDRTEKEPKGQNTVIEH